MVLKFLHILIHIVIHMINASAHDMCGFFDNLLEAVPSHHLGQLIFVPFIKIEISTDYCRLFGVNPPFQIIDKPIKRKDIIKI